MTVESDVLAEIKPTPEESREILAKADRLRNLAQKYSDDHNLDAEVRFVGSVGKGTFLRDTDIDLFLMFPTSFSREEMERLGIQAGMDLVKGRLMYAEHPYTSGFFEGLEVDIVPCYKLPNADHIITSVDRTPFHAEYILTHSDDRLKDEIRLMKKFMKGIGAYGAEPDVRGFSGYLCELLTLKYGGFIEAVIAGSKWKQGTVLYIESKGEKMKSPLVFYDPVDPKRNVASAVHEDTLALFINACKSYIQRPDRRFFFPSARTIPPKEEIVQLWEKRGSGLVSISFEKPDIIKENLDAQLWKSRNGLTTILNRSGFEVMRAVHYTDEKFAILAFELVRSHLPLLHLHDGPPVHVENGDAFCERWRDNPYGKPFIKDGKWNVVCERQFTDAREMIVSEAYHAGLGKYLSSEKMKVFSGKDVFDHVSGKAMMELFLPRFPWEN